MKSLLKLFLLCGIIAVCSLSMSSAAEWQWSVPVPPLPDRAKETPRAYLWIPANCDHVRGVVFGHHNMEEIGVFEHPAFRKTLAELGFAEVWVAPAFDRNFRFDKGAGEKFDAMMAALAEQSGYSELTNAPLIPCGHSAAASMPWYIAAWKPERVIAGLSFSGQWPYVPDPGNWPPYSEHAIDSVPGFVTQGEYEWADETIPRGVVIKNEHPLMPLSAMGCPADGHFAAMDDKVDMLALYVKKAAHYRLAKNISKDGAVKLNPIDVTKTGWLAERYATDKNPSAPAAPVSEFKGDRTNAFWYFDGELAKAVEAFQQKQRGKPALLGYVQDGQIVPQGPTHQQVTLKFSPEADGVTFKLTGTFLDVVPGGSGRPARWAHKKAGEHIDPPQTKVPIEIHRICGPVKQTSADTWQLAFNRASYLNDVRGDEAWFVAVWPGDDGFKRAVQQSMMPIPHTLNDGRSQTIDFPKIEDQKNGTKTLVLKATATSGLTVGFFVREGPAEIDGNTLKFTAIPPRAKFPVKVTVVAWQHGRAGDIKSAEPVTREFLIQPRK